MASVEEVEAVMTDLHGTDLEEAQRKILEESSPKDVDLFNLEYLNHVYTVGHLIKYLHPVARFSIKNGGPTGGLPAEPRPTLPNKPFTDPELIKLRCGFATDSADVKSWAKSRAIKTVAGKDVYLIISDAKEEVDFAAADIKETPGMRYNIKDSFGSLINDRNVSYAQEFYHKEDIQVMANEAAKKY
ncbi:hypothetical protein MMC12_007272 [Toensbergia leucococca]|nr:hypothetical protein [Toensbergia leucococca]